MSDFAAQTLICFITRARPRVIFCLTVSIVENLLQIAPPSGADHRITGGRVNFPDKCRCANSNTWIRVCAVLINDTPQSNYKTL